MRAGIGEELELIEALLDVVDEILGAGETAFT